MTARKTRAEQSEERRAAIVHAALDEFIQRGFAGARIEDVAARAGVAKGTVYLHFRDKEALFEAIVRDALSPVVAGLSAVEPPPGIGVRAALERIALPLLTEIVESRRGDVLRLLISEGRRFPALAAFYHREILTPAMANIRRLLRLAAERGELRNPGMADFPHLMAAPMVVSVIWQGLFQRLDPLDFQGLFREHLNTVFADPSEAGEHSSRQRGKGPDSGPFRG
jgi:AcrR family transcriptional regulator